jgi:predicted metal-dependent enzyme (double-stranded beta helix superfamily)
MGSMQKQSLPTSSVPFAPMLNAGLPLQNEKLLPELAEKIEDACCGPAGLIPKAVRQALDHEIDAVGAQRLTQEILALPRAEHGYTRHILHADPKGRFTIVALVWGQDQFSPVHAHYTWCAYKVLSGLLTESHFEWDRTQQKVALSGQALRPSGQSVCGHAGLELIHQLGNQQAEPAISIHVYGMDADRIGSHVNRVLELANNA